jgi:hypothetical protein
VSPEVILSDSIKGVGLQMDISKRRLLKQGLAIGAMAAVPSGIASIAFADGGADKVKKPNSSVSDRCAQARAELKEAEASGNETKIKAAQRNLERAAKKSQEATNKEFAARKALKEAEKALKSATKARKKADKALRKALDEEDHWCN